MAETKATQVSAKMPRILGPSSLFLTEIAWNAQLSRFPNYNGLKARISKEYFTAMTG